MKLVEFDTCDTCGKAFINPDMVASVCIVEQNDVWHVTVNTTGTNPKGGSFMSVPYCSLDEAKDALDEFMNAAQNGEPVSLKKDGEADSKKGSVGTMVVDDPGVLEKIMKDPDVMVRVRDSVVASAANFAHSEFKKCIRDAVQTEIRCMANPAVDNEIFATNGMADWLPPRLSEQVHDRIVSTLKLYVNDTIHDAIENLEECRAIRDAVSHKVKEIWNYDIESVVRKEARVVAKNLFDKLSERLS